jgi:hypothetical protein
MRGLWHSAYRSLSGKECSKNEEVTCSISWTICARFNVNANVPVIALSATYIGKGGGGQLEYNAKNWLGVVGDLGGFYVISSRHGSFV